MQRGGRFERADRQQSTRRTIIAGRAPRIGEQSPRVVGVRQQASPGFGQRNAAPMAVKEGAAEVSLKRLDASGDIGLHGVELGGRTVHAAKPRYRLEDFQVARIHQISKFQIGKIICNRFYKIITRLYVRGAKTVRGLRRRS